MKPILFLTTILLSFSIANAQSKIYKVNEYGRNKELFMMIEGGKIYTIDKNGYNKTSIAMIEGGKIYIIDKNGYNKTSVALIEGGYSQAELAYILTRIGLL